MGKKKTKKGAKQSPKSTKRTASEQTPRKKVSKPKTAKKTARKAVKKKAAKKTAKTTKKTTRKAAAKATAKSAKKTSRKTARKTSAGKTSSAGKTKTGSAKAKKAAPPTKSGAGKVAENKPTAVAPSKKTKNVAKAKSSGKAPAKKVRYTDPPLPKSRLNEKQLQQFREMLLTKRAELLGYVDNMSRDALGRNRQDASGDLSSMPIHMADIGSDNYEQEFSLGLIATERKLLREIDEALDRIEQGTYGICLGTHKPIKIARLRAKPWARYCIEYARQMELGRF